jgi:dolichol-phosphate mannosyltransferase
LFWGVEGCGNTIFENNPLPFDDKRNFKIWENLQNMTNRQLESEWVMPAQQTLVEKVSAPTIIDSETSDNVRVFVVLPCYNEEKNLPILIDDLSDVLSILPSFEIIAVNDGSSDNSHLILKNLAAKYPIRMLHHKKRMGLSATLKDGLLDVAAISSSNDLVITMDADNTHKSFYIRKMLEAVHEGAEIVIASRYVTGGLQIGVPNNRILLSRCLNYLLNFCSGLKIQDVTSGYRCYRASILKKGLEKYNSHLVDAEGFEVQVELIVKLGTLSRKICEIPFKLRYDEKNGRSKMPFFKTIQNHVILIFKILLWRLQENS